MTDESTVEVATPIPIPAVPTQTAPEVRVKIFNDAEGRAVIECNHELPPIKEIMARLTPRQQKTCKYYYSYRYTLQQTVMESRRAITYRDWADAIGAAIMHKLANDEGAVYESKALQEGAYLAMGDQVYRLSPVAMARQTKALSAVQECAKRKTKVEIERLTEEAKMASDALIAAANAKKAEADEYIRQTHKSKPVPEWIRQGSVTCRYSSTKDCWCVQFKIVVKIEGFDVPISPPNFGRAVIYSWAATSEVRVPVTMWVPLHADGDYEITSICVDQGSPVLPHVSRTGACMEPGDAPRQITSLRELQSLASSITRCLSRVQLNSLLVTGWDWMETFNDCVPVDLKQNLLDGSNGTNLALRLYAEQEAARSYSLPIELENEENTIWTTA